MTYAGSHALAAQVLGDAFNDLGVSASVLEGRTWHPVHIPTVFQQSDLVPDVVVFEFVHGAERRRAAHNERCARQVRRTGEALMAEHAGFRDFFVPIGDRASRGILVTGPFAIARPTSADLRTRWRWLTGRSAHTSDPEFARYLATTLATLTFEPAQLSAFRAWLGCFAAILAGQGDVEVLASRAQGLRPDLQESRFVERMWAAVRAMVDEGVWRAWQSTDVAYRVGPMGVKRLPEHAIVGLLARREPEADPLEELLRRDALQRACVAFAKRRGGTLCGRIGDHGVALLAEQSGSQGRVRARLAELAEQLAAVGRRHGLTLHMGISAPARPFSLPERYRAALAAAERALTQSEAVVFADVRGGPGGRASLGHLRRELLRAVIESPSVLAARFERYLESVRTRCGYRAERTGAHLEATFDQIVDALRARGALDERSASELMRGLDTMTADAVTVGELSIAYRTCIAEIEGALDRPDGARQDRGLRRAIAYIRDHADEPLSLARVARVAGFAPSSFSRLFASTEHCTFREHTHRLRVERAKQLLVSTKLSSERVAQLCGYRSRQRFHAMFTRIAGMTPRAYRRAPAPDR